MGKTAATPAPPYYAVIFTSMRTPQDNGYAQTAARLLDLVREQPGFLGVEAARGNDLGLTVSYWDSLDSAAAWKQNLEHLQAQAKGREKWYSEYSLRVARVEKEVRFQRD